MEIKYIFTYIFIFIINKTTQITSKFSWLFINLSYHSSYSPKVYIHICSIHIF